MPISNRLYKQSQRLHPRQSMPWRDYFREILAKDAVLWTALTLGVLSSLAVRPSPASLGSSIDFKTLACLASLMAASGGFMISGVFDLAAARLVNRCRTTRALTAVLVFGTFFASMLITNDVALIVFVPMAILAFRRANSDPTLAIVLQTVAANVGSILLPMGNPQNLYLYSRYSLSFWPFFKTVAPLSLAGFLALALLCLFVRADGIVCPRVEVPRIRAGNVYLYSALFVVAILAVFDVVAYPAALAMAVAVLIVKGRNLMQQVDYALLLTFVGFFVFVGNVSTVPEIGAAIRDFVVPGPYLAGVAASQIISNVPAAIMLSGFTEDASALLAGVSAGGCGTPIASMASLISYKLFAREGGSKIRYLTVFTMINILFLAVLTGAYLLARPE